MDLSTIHAREALFKRPAHLIVEEANRANAGETIIGSHYPTNLPNQIMWDNSLIFKAMSRVHGLV